MYMFGLERRNGVNYLFIHIPKTAGSTIHYSILGRKPNVESVHWRYIDYCSTFNEEVLKNFWKFCFMREPVDRFLSRIRYLKSGLSKGQPQHTEEREFVEQFSNVSQLVNFLKENKNHWFLKCPHGLPQKDFICDKNGNIAVDFIGRTENFSQDIKVVMKRLFISEPEINKKNINVSESNSEIEALKKDCNFCKAVRGLYEEDADLYFSLD